MFDEEKIETDVFVTVNGNCAVINSLGEGIVRVAVYGMDGRMDSVTQMNPTGETRVELRKELQIVSVMLADGVVRNFKIIAYL